MDQKSAHAGQDFFPIFLSVILVVRNQAGRLKDQLSTASQLLQGLVSDYELVVVDNASQDQSVALLKEFTQEGGMPNLQVYALTKEVDLDTASWVGLENALGDFVAVVDPCTDSISFLPQMLDKALSGADVVFASNQEKVPQSLAYRLAYAVFNQIYQSFGGVNLEKEAPRYRLLSKRLLNFILQHSQPVITYRHLPATGGFSRAYLHYQAQVDNVSPKRLGESIDRGMRLLFSTTRAPMRIVTSLSLFGAVANLLYSGYVLAVGVFKTDVAPGWVSLSLQQSGMFFLISLVLLVLGEYILNMASLSNEGPLYHVGQEFNSATITRRSRLNVDEVKANSQSPAAPLGAPGSQS